MCTHFSFFVVYNDYMILYIDETENPNYFIVTGLLVNSETRIERCYKSFKKSLKSLKINAKYKSILFTEFKSTLLDSRYQKIKIKMLNSIFQTHGSIIYSCYLKKYAKMNQTIKESTYISLFTKIVNSINNKIDIIYDSFNKPNFEDIVKKHISNLKNVISIKSGDSQLIHGIQFVDNICSVIRLYKTLGLNSKEVKSFYPIIEKMVMEV